MSDILPKVTELLVRITGAKEIQSNPDINLFEDGILDSLGLVELIAALSEEMGVQISPAEVERSAWESPRKICAYLQSISIQRPA